MSIYKIIKISILLGTGIIVACSADKTEIKPQAGIKTKMEALRVYIDPVTGERLSSPPVNNDNTVKFNNANSTASDQTIYFSAPKKSTVPGVGVYIELESPPSTVNGQ